MFLSWFKSLFKEKKMPKGDRRHKKLPRMLFKELQDYAARHSLMDDLKGKTYQGPAEDKVERYLEDYQYFCAILQHFLLQGKRIVLPGIGSMQLCRRKPRIIKKSGMFDYETQEKGDVYLKAYMFRSMRPYFDSFDKEKKDD